MTQRQFPRHARGFTLIEVLVAMVVAAIGIGALLATLASSADTIGHLRERSFAEWIALNRLSETRLQNPAASAGVTTGEVEYAGIKWKWQQEVINQDIAGILRVDVSVARAVAKAAPAKKGSESKDGEEAFPAVAKAYGFIGTSVAAPNGMDPAWILPPPRNPDRP